MRVPTTMTAVRLYEHGGPDVLTVQEVPVPVPGPGDVLVRVRATSVNWWDVGYRRGTVAAPPGRPPLALPFQLGREGAGEVAALGAGVDAFAVGDRVVLMTCPACGRCWQCRSGADNLCVDTELPGHTRYGAYAEYVLAPASGLLRAPANVEFEKLACLLWSYGTVLHMVDARARVRPGDAVLVTGASGGMGTACLQLAKLAGAEPVLALTGSPDKADQLRQAGADLVLDYRAPTVVEQIRAETGGRGVDVVLDNVGGPMVDLAVNAARLGGRVVLAAIMGGKVVELAINRIFGKHLDLLGTRAATRQEQERVLELAARGRIDPVIGARFALRDAAAAHAAQERGGHTGKIVLTP
jgi:NADPH:quinone reductase-like Zn-dependent oxidoreductase